MQGTVCVLGETDKTTDSSNYKVNCNIVEYSTHMYSMSTAHTIITLYTCTRVKHLIMYGMVQYL